MRIFENVRLWLENLFQPADKAGDIERKVQKAISEYRLNLKKVNDVLVNLNYQEKRTTKMVDQKEIELQEIQNFLERLVKDGRDDEAMQLIEKMEFIQTELHSLKNTAAQLKQEKESALKMRKEASGNLVAAERQLAGLGSRIQSLRIRKDLQGQIAQLKGKIDHFENGQWMAPLQEELDKLEGSMELIEDRGGDILTELRHEQEIERRQDLLNQMKLKLGPSISVAKADGAHSQ